MIAEKSLKTFLMEEKEGYSLENSVRIVQKILYALDRLHRNGQLHLAVCPENIFLFPDRAVLLGADRGWEDSEAAAYAAPEVRLKNLAETGPPSDVYSVCAVFFHLLMRRKLKETEVMGKGLCRCFSEKLEVFQDVPQGAARKTVQILFKGLHTLPRKRYSCAAELLGEMEELAVYLSLGKEYMDGMEERKENCRG